MSYASEVLADNPTLYWRFTETSGSPVADSSANVLDGAAFGGFTRNATSLVPSTTNPAIALGGTGWVEHADDPLLDFTAPFTLECWVKPSTVATLKVFIAKHDSYNFGTNGAKLWLSIIGKADLISTGTSLIAGSTYYVAVRYDAAFDAHFYLDGAFLDTVAYTADVNLTANSFIVGQAGGGGLFYSGDIDEVAVWDSDIGAARILAHYTAGITPEAVQNLAPVIYGRGAC